MLQRPLGSGSIQKLGMEQEVDDMDVEDALVVVPALDDVLAGGWGIYWEMACSQLQIQLRALHYVMLA